MGKNLSIIHGTFIFLINTKKNIFYLHKQFIHIVITAVILISTSRMSK